MFTTRIARDRWTFFFLSINRGSANYWQRYTAWILLLETGENYGLGVWKVRATCQVHFYSAYSPSDPPQSVRREHRWKKGSSRTYTHTPSFLWPLATYPYAYIYAYIITVIIIVILIIMLIYNNRTGDRLIDFLRGLHTLVND